MVLSMAVTSKTGISWGTAEEDGLVWAEQSTAVSNIEKTQRMRVVILASSCELFDTKHTVFSGQGRLEVTVQQVPGLITSDVHNTPICRMSKLPHTIPHKKRRTDL